MPPYTEGWYSALLVNERIDSTGPLLLALPSNIIRKTMQTQVGDQSDTAHCSRNPGPPLEEPLLRRSKVT